MAQFADDYLNMAMEEESDRPNNPYENPHPISIKTCRLCGQSRLI